MGMSEERHSLYSQLPACLPCCCYSGVAQKHTLMRDQKKLYNLNKQHKTPKMLPGGHLLSVGLRGSLASFGIQSSMFGCAGAAGIVGNILWISSGE